MEFLSEEWVAELATQGAKLPKVDGIDMVIQHEIAGAPSGKVRFYTVYKDGQLTEAAIGKNGDATIQVRAKAAEAIAVMNGDMSPDVGFMQGRLKVDGDYRKLMIDHRDFRATKPYQKLWAQMAKTTSS